MTAFFRRFHRLLRLLLWFAYTGSKAFLCYANSWTNIKKTSEIAEQWGSGIARIINLQITVHGDKANFKGGLIVSNHLGYIDIITHAATFPLRFTPKADIAKWPFLGWYLGLNHPIWIDRRSRQSSRKTLQDFIDTMNHDIPLIVYPEGTSTDGMSILPFKSTPFEAAVAGDFSVLPVLTRYKDEADKDILCWYGDMTLLPHVWQLLGRQKVEVEVYLLPPVSSTGLNRKELAERVFNVMVEEYNKRFPKSTGGQ